MRLAAFIPGIFGIGGEAHGEPMLSCGKKGEPLTAEQITKECTGKVLVANTSITKDALRRAAEVGVKGVVIGGIAVNDITDFLGYEIGVAITGEENIRTTLIVTEGFGEIKMSEETYKLLEAFDGKLVCINGATQVRAGVVRPEIIIPRSIGAYSENEVDETAKDMELGMLVRIIWGKNFGALGRISGLPPEPQTIPTESKVRIVEVELEGGERIIIPRANVELID